jgi:hypothetical protein
MIRWQQPGVRPLPTVGDTLTIVQRVAAPVGAVVQARAPADSTIATLVAPPLVQREGDSVRIAYTVAIWAPGRSDLRLLGPIVVPARGAVDTLADAHVTVEVRSLLPTARQPANIPPKAARGWLSRTDRSLLPLAVLAPLALAVLALAWWRWRRRGPAPLPAERPVRPGLTLARLDAWLAAGEVRLALEHFEAEVRHRPEFEAWRTRAEAIRFSEGREDELAQLLREGWARAHEASAP